MGAIYKIVNVLNNKFYVGSTVDTRVRFQDHRRKLRKGTHHCVHLQASWNKYGEEKFEFVVVDTVPDDDLFSVENQWLREHFGKPHCYNTGTSSLTPWRGIPKEQHPAFGKSKSAEARAKISETLKEYYAAAPENHPRYGVKHTDEAKAKMAKKLVHKGESHYRFGKTLSEEVRAKIGNAQRGVSKGVGRTVSEEGLKKIADAAAAGRYSHQKGKKKSAEMRAKISKPIVELTTQMTFPSLSAALLHYGMQMPTLTRALKTGKPIDKRSEKFAGLQFAYAEKL